MSLLELKEIVHERGADGELLPIEIELEVLREYETVEEGGKKKSVLKKPGPTVKVTPMPRGEIKTLFAGAKKAKKEGEGLETTTDQDGEIIRKHLIEPKVPDKQIKDLKPTYAGAIATAILAISLNTDQGEIQEAGRQAVKKYAEKLDGELEKK